MRAHVDLLVHRPPRGILLSALLLVSVLLGASCGDPTSAGDPAPAGRGGGRGTGGGAGGEGVPVSIASVSEKAVPIEITTVGTAEPFSTVEVRSQVAGTLTEVAFKEGDDVQAGQLLFTIDPRPFEVAVRQAEATRDRNAAQAANAETVRVQNENLLKNGLISRAEYDASATAATAFKSAVAADNAAVDNARLQLQYTQIMAPLSGRTGALLVHQGSLVRSGDTTALVVINQIAPIRVAFAVPGQYLVEIQRGQARGPLGVIARANDGDDAQAGVVSFIDNAVDPATATIRLKAILPNANRRLWPGNLTQTTLRLGVDRRAIVVPSAAVQNGQQGQYVYVVGEDQTVTMRPVKIARTHADDAVVAEGLRPGESVVTDGQLRLTPGARVSVKPALGGATR
jgi:multidrug efflux system membrane fusion protein